MRHQGSFKDQGSFKGLIREPYKAISKLSKRLFLGYFEGVLGAFDGLLEGSSGYINAKALVM